MFGNFRPALRSDPRDRNPMAVVAPPREKGIGKQRPRNLPAAPTPPAMLGFPYDLPFDLGDVAANNQLPYNLPFDLG